MKRAAGAIIVSIVILGIVALGVWSGLQPDEVELEQTSGPAPPDSLAEHCRTAVGEPTVEEVTPGVWVANGYDLANTILVQTSEGNVIIDVSMLNADVLAGKLSDWLTDRKDLLAKAEKAHGLDRPNALSRITELCLEQAGVAS